MIFCPPDFTVVLVDSPKGRRTMQPDLPSDLISTAEAGTIVGVKASVVLGWVKAGRLPGWKVGPKLYRVSRADVLALIVPGERPKPAKSPPAGVRSGRRSPGYYLACNRLLLGGLLSQTDYQRFYR